MRIFSLINPAGGLYYHFSALKYRKKYWQPFVKNLDIFFDNWKPPTNKLVIIGSSGGYCLPPNLIKRFKTITLIDIDPLAKLIFNARFNREVTQKDINYFSNNFERLKDLSTDFPNQALLFSNILGQLPFLDIKKCNNYSNLHKFFQTLLKKNSWASFHDKLSIHFNSSDFKLCWPLILQGQKNQEHLDNLNYQQQLRPFSANVVNHQTDNLFLNINNKQNFIWQRSPKSYHIIEAVAQS